MEVKNIELVSIDKNGVIPYMLVKCDLVRDNGEVVTDVGEFVSSSCLLDEVDGNLDRKEFFRLNEEELNFVRHALNDWLDTNVVSPLTSYCYHMNNEYDNDNDYDFCCCLGAIKIYDGYAWQAISMKKLDEIAHTSGADYFNIELDVED